MLARRSFHYIFTVAMLCLCADCADSSVQVAEPELLDSYYGDGEPMWVGTVEKHHLMQAPFDEWYESAYESYPPRSDAVAALSTALDGLEVEVYFGTWCDDSRQVVPRLIRIFDEAGFALDRIEMVALSDRPGEFKLSPGGRERKRLIHLPVALRTIRFAVQRQAARGQGRSGHLSPSVL